MPSQVQRPHYWFSFAVIAVGVSSFTLMQSMTVPVLPRIETELDTDQSTVTWVLTAYLLSASVFTPIMGRLGDILGKKRMLVVSLLMLALGSLLASFATSIEVMIAARVVQGVGGGVLPLSFGIVRDEFPRAKVAGAVGVISSLLAAGFGLGIVIAGPIVDAFGYRWLFLLPFIVTSVAAVAAALIVPESPVRTPGKIPVLPALLMSGWLIALLVGLSEAPKWGWTSAGVIGLVALAAVLAVVWVLTERRQLVPLIDMRMMRLPGIWTTNLVALLVGMSMFAAFAFMPQFNQTPAAAGYGFGATVTESGRMLLPMATATFLMGFVSAPIARRFGAKRVVVAGCLVGATGMLLVALRHDARVDMMIAVAVVGVGTGLVFASLANLVIAAVTPEQTGAASGMNANIRTIGGSIGTAVMSSIVTAHLLPTGLPAEIGYTRGFLMLSGVMLTAAVAALLIPRVGRRRLEERLTQPPFDRELAIMGA